MTIRKTNTSRRKPKGIDLTPFLIVIGLVLLLLTFYIGFRIHTSGRRLISISVVALIAGVIFENWRLTGKWQTVLYTALGSFLLSFSTFLPGKREQVYDFENHIEIWPYAFIFFFIIFSIVLNKDKIIPKLTEGITLLLSIAAIYWVIDYGFVHTNNILIKVVMMVGLAFSLFSLFHAFTNTVLSRTHRLVLSIWSSIIMMLFAIDNIYLVYQNEQIENTTDLTSGLYVLLQFFLLGVSSIYISQNILMIISFLPSKENFFNAQYFRDLKELKSDHIKRYDDKQVSFLHSGFCILFSGIFFASNYYFQIMPRNLAIWLLFVIFLFVVILYSSLTEKKNLS